MRHESLTEPPGLSTLVSAPSRRGPVAPPMPSGRALLAGTGGFLLAGASAGIGATAPEIALRAVPSGLAVGVCTLLLTGPALVVGHQSLGLDARPADLGAALADGFVRAGRLAAGLAPALAFFALTTGLSGAAAAVVAAAAGAAGFGWSAVGLRAAEPGARRMDALVVAWTALAGLVALRLAVDVAARVLE